MGWTGSPPNQVFTRTDGTRTGTEVWQEAEGAGVNIISSDHDVHDQDQGDGINECLKKDGGNQPTANIPFNSKKITGFAQGSDRTDSIRLDQVQDGDLIYASVGGSADAIELSTSPTCSPVEGMSIVFIAGSDSTGAVTVDLNSNGAVAVQWLGAALSGGEIKSGQAHRITYDGTQWQLENPSLLGWLASTANGLGASLIGVEDDAGNFDATDVEAALAEILSNLASNSTDLGASLVGIEDSGGIITATDVEGALAEIQGDLDAVEADYLTSSDILDEDDFSTDSATKAPSQQSTKAYVDTEINDATPAASTTTAGLQENADQSEMEAASSSTRTVTPNVLHHHPGVAKAWAYISQSGGTPSLETSYNVSGIVDNGTGDITITIDTDFSSANWSGNATPVGSGGDSIVLMEFGKMAGSVTYHCRDSSTEEDVDPEGYNFSAFGDQ